jgi:phage terminase large subunit GpA-like protein
MGARDHLEDVAEWSSVARGLRAEFLAPPQILSVTQWAEQHRILSGKDSAEPGPYRVARTPYAAEPMDCLSAHSPVEEVVLMWGAQTAKTTIGSNWIGYLADINPGPVMIVQPTIDMAKRYSRQRLEPMIAESCGQRGQGSFKSGGASQSQTSRKYLDGGRARLVYLFTVVALKAVEVIGSGATTLPVGTTWFTARKVSICSEQPIGSRWLEQMVVRP